LVPKKASAFIKEVADKLGIDPDIVDAAVSCYWKEISKGMHDLKGNNINVINFGAFSTREWKLIELEKKYRSYVDINSEANTFRKYALLREAQERLVLMQKLLNDYEEEKVKKQKVKEKRNVQETKNNLGEQEEHISGD
jgi:nucleoid DNA-binding protein